MATSAAPDGVEGASGGARKLSEELAHLKATFAERSVELRDVIGVLRGRAYILLLILLALPFCTPVPLPGLSTPFGLVIALIAVRLALGQKPWLPERLLRMRLPPGFFRKLIGFTHGLVRVFEKLIRPRWLPVTGAKYVRQIHALAILISALSLLLPLPIPFTNTFPAWTIILIAGGLLERDGLFVLAGYAMFAAGVAYFFLLGHTAQQLWESVTGALFS